MTRAQLPEDLDADFLRFIGDPDPRPAALYRRLREFGPVARTSADFWVTTGYAETKAIVLNDAVWSRNAHSSNQAEVLRFDPANETSIARRVVGSAVLWIDDPDHGRIRGVVKRVFTPRAVQALRAKIEQVVTDQMEKSFGEANSIEMVEEFALLVPTTVIMELLGFDPHSDEYGFREFVAVNDGIVRVIEPSATQADLSDVDEIFAACTDYVLEMAARRRADPKNDLLSALVLAQEDGERLSDDELVAMVIFLIGAGHETTASVIANTTLNLLENPQALASLRDDPSLSASATEEGLRYDGAARGALSRWAREDTEICGQSVAKGDKVIALIGAANRDPLQFPDPERFDIQRTPNYHLAFGGGAHFCLGASLARTELQVALRGISQLPQLRLDGEPRWKQSFIIRGLESLPVAWG